MANEKHALEGLRVLDFTWVYAPFIGENNREILSVQLGYSDEATDKLFAEGLIYKEDPVDRLPEELKRLTGSLENDKDHQ